MFDTRNYINGDNQIDARWQAEEDQAALELTEAITQIRKDVWDTYERDMEIYALVHDLQSGWGSMWDENELITEITYLYKFAREKFIRLYEGVYTTLHPFDLARFVNC